VKNELDNETIITIKYRDQETAKAVNSAISPDNLTTLKTINITTRVDERTLIIKVASKKLSTLIATLDDLLSCVQAAESAITEVNPSDKVP
jgi:tRNA threonylcarbamoyladenosine modification (KEOPS) complex  Pcc1 subunit